MIPVKESRADPSLDNHSCRTPRWVGGHALDQKTYASVAAALFLVVAIMHLLRIIFGWEVQIGGLTIPFWVSWLALVIAGALAYLGFAQTQQTERGQGDKISAPGPR